MSNGYKTTWMNTPSRRKIHAKTRGRCFYCGVHVQLVEGDPLPRDWLLVKGSSRLMTPDHAHPKVRGGADGVENRLPACRSCNAMKGALTVAEFRFVRAFRSRDFGFSFPCEPKLDSRDWLFVCSEDQENILFRRNFPAATIAYARGKKGSVKKPALGARQ